MKKLLSLLLVGILCVSMLAGCSYRTNTTPSNTNPSNTTNNTDNTKNEPDTTNTASPVETTDTVSPVETAATSIGDFKAEDLQGNEVTKDIFSNYDLTLVNLFATFCSPCIKEMPYLNEIDKEMADKSVNVIGIPLDVNEGGKVDKAKLAKLNQIIKSTGAQYDIILPDEVLRSGVLKGVNSVPQSFFVDKNGNIVSETYLGSHSKKEWTDIINKELANLKK